MVPDRPISRVSAAEKETRGTAASEPAVPEGGGDRKYLEAPLAPSSPLFPQGPPSPLAPEAPGSPAALALLADLEVLQDLEHKPHRDPLPRLTREVLHGEVAELLGEVQQGRVQRAHLGADGHQLDVLQAVEVVALGRHGGVEAGDVAPESRDVAVQTGLDAAQAHGDRVQPAADPSSSVSRRSRPSPERRHSPISVRWSLRSTCTCVARR
ncbi:hypothetical protein CRUP_033404 [Coryphaenoides rupestris]|nr:hypothetical protein CRUP_033404 [Coryphaenoides rupestris]